MEENAYISDILSGLGIAINEKNNSEIIINYPINFDKKSMQFYISEAYQVTVQPLGNFLADFLNTDFNIENEFYDFFNKYSLSLLNYKKLMNIFTVYRCDEKKFKQFIGNLLSKNKTTLIKLQEQTDMILDYCLLNPNKKASNFKPIERLYVLRRISPNLTLLNENKSAYYSVNLFSDFPGETEKQIYDFLSKKKNIVTELDLILPYNFSGIIYKSICAILKETVYLKICKNCNKYFIANNILLNYCSNIAPNEIKKTCKDIGRKNVFEINKNNDPILSLYYKVYNRKSTMKSRNSDIKKYVDDFNHFKDVGKKKLNKYKNGDISSEEFKKWIEKNM